MGLAANWISVSAMVFTGDFVEPNIYKNDDFFTSYLTIDSTLGIAWAPVSFPPKAKQVMRMDASVYDGLEAWFGIIDVAALGVDLVKVDLSTGAITTVLAIGTAGRGAPGDIILTDNVGTDTSINNKKWAWYLRFRTELSGDKDNLRLYGVRIRYK